MPYTYYIALGSNLGDRENNLLRAWEMMERHATQRRLSGLYESEPMYVTDQPLFLNAVGMASSDLEPGEMLDAVHRIEAQLGRDRSRERRMGPRTIDLDILLCGDLVVNKPDLIIPHPRMAERGFVLVPLVELSPHLHDPRTGLKYADLLPARMQGVYSYPRR
ncbi:MAG: 2-amino-4-hydroxy-6-hydroxymethyldihydropteridine diphosphokinase [Spirochaetia bacterium]